MFLLRNKKNIDTFWLKKKAPYQELCMTERSSSDVYTQNKQFNKGFDVTVEVQHDLGLSYSHMT